MHFNIIKFEKIYNPDNEITSSEFISKKKSFNDEGLFSERIFGENSDSKGIDILGWINFHGYKIISPTFFKRLQKVLKSKTLNKIISYDMETDENGQLIPAEPETLEYQNSGITGFIENFEDIMDLYADKERPEYETIMKAYNEDKLFISVYPVFSAKLRPAMLFKGSKTNKPSIKYDDINGLYNFIINYSCKLKENLEIEDDSAKILTVNKLLYNLQDYCNQVVEYIIDSFLKEKKGVCRRLIASTRVNYSSRNVLTPGLQNNIDDVSLPYLTFLELYRFLLINLIVKTEGITPNEAEIYFESCKRHFDKKMYKYMNQLITKSKKGLKIILNRNPSINIGSLLILNVTKVKSDFNDLTLSVSNNILTNLNADYDGDVLNIIALLSDKQKEIFSRLKPASLIIHPNNGRFDRAYSLTKDARYGYELLNN
jgi:DNA-directed RNA polymerase beta' subunit